MPQLERWRENRGMWKSAVEPITLCLSCQCSTTELWQLENHQPSQTSICLNLYFRCEVTRPILVSFFCSFTPFPHDWTISLTNYSSMKPTQVLNLHISLKVIHTVALSVAVTSQSTQPALVLAWSLSSVHSTQWHRKDFFYWGGTVWNYT